MRLLWLKTELLHPVDKGGRIRTYQMLRALARDHDIIYLTLDDGAAAPDAADRAREYCGRLITVPFHPPPRGSAGFYAALAANLASSLPYAVARYRSPAFRARLAALAPADRFDVVVCDFLAPAVNVPPVVPAPAVLFQHNVEAEIWRRHAQVAGSRLRRAYFRRQWRRMVAFERAACRRFDRVIAVSEHDAEHIRRAYGVDAAWVPTGVDTEYFRPDGWGPREPAHLVFTGSMDWMPNQDAVMFLVEGILPELRRRVPGVRVTVVGRSPPARLTALAAAAPNLTVTGGVPDVRPYLAAATVAVVPLRVGGGTRLKIYEAMAMECPVVSTAVGAEGLPLQDGEHLLLADQPEDFAEACARVLQERAWAAGLAERAARYVREWFGWNRVAARFADLCRQAAARPADPPSS